jgi:predicted lipoprotein with Yx(FWY)xxD motif
MRYPARLIALIATPLLLASGVVGVSAGSRTTAAAPMVKTVDGKLLVNAKGLAQYIFTPDSKNTSTCYKTCAKFWPPTIVPSGMTVPKTMKGIPGTFGVAMRTDGTQQLTYDGLPLYSFIKDKDSGDLYGEGLLASGGYWWAVVVKGANM